MTIRNNPVSVSRDPFARVSIIRRKVKVYKGTCAWCGQPRKDGTLFEYGVDPDSISDRKHWDGKYFCSKGCRDTFYGE